MIEFLDNSCHYVDSTCVDFALSAYWSGRTKLGDSLCGECFGPRWKANPDLTSAKARELLFESEYSTTDGQKIINPGRFLEFVKNAKAMKTE